MNTDQTWISFHGNFLQCCLSEWAIDRCPGSACNALANAGMLERYTPGALATIDLPNDLVIAAMQHICKLGNLSSRSTSDYDATFDMALCADRLFTAWLVANHLRIDRKLIECNHSLAYAKCIL